MLLFSHDQTTGYSPPFSVLMLEIFYIILGFISILSPMMRE
jgi:hypothetical protein